MLRTLTLLIQVINQMALDLSVSKLRHACKSIIADINLSGVSPARPRSRGCQNLRRRRFQMTARAFDPRRGEWDDLKAAGDGLRDITRASPLNHNKEGR